jgi:hypothetical protein
MTFEGRFPNASVIRITVLAGMLINTALLPAAAPPAGCDAINLDQGWNHQQSEEFWFTPQGSHLMPYAWFLALEVSNPATQTLFRDRSNMDRFGYIWVPASPKNPDELPIGFTKDVAATGEGYLGLTCAACHTGSLTIAGKSVIVEGGPTLGDFQTFMAESTAALETAATVPAKFDRFSKRVLHSESPSPADVQKLQEQMKVRLLDLQTRVTENTPSTPFGNGRVDAIGHIFTRVLAQDFNIPANAKPPYAPPYTAPVSYPFLWDTPQHDVVQWNGSAPNARLLALGPLGRNVGEVLGVFGEVDVVPGRKIPMLPFLTKPPQFISSANITNLLRLEDIVRTLWSPVWPKNCLPLADAKTLARGKKVYEDNCIGCHRILGDPERKQEDRQITAVLKTLPEVGTDPTMAMNFATRTAKTGPLEGYPDIIELNKFGSEASAHLVVMATVNGVVLRTVDRRDGVPWNVDGIIVNPVTEVAAFKRAIAAAATPRYKARPLNGIWATAPYLHNGSVPTLWDLLNPTKDRPQVFYVGSREFDPQKVGLVTKEAPGTFRFDTSPQGNWRNGHEFGTALPANDKKDLLEFLKTL